MASLSAHISEQSLSKWEVLLIMSGATSMRMAQKKKSRTHACARIMAAGATWVADGGLMPVKRLCPVLHGSQRVVCNVDSTAPISYVTGAGHGLCTDDLTRRTSTHLLCQSGCDESTCTHSSPVAARCTRLLSWWQFSPSACTALQTLVAVRLLGLFRNSAVAHHNASPELHWGLLALHGLLLRKSLLSLCSCPCPADIGGDGSAHADHSLLASPGWPHGHRGLDSHHLLGGAAPCQGVALKQSWHSKCSVSVLLWPVPAAQSPHRQGGIHQVCTAAWLHNSCTFS